MSTPTRPTLNRSTNKRKRLPSSSSDESQTEKETVQIDSAAAALPPSTPQNQNKKRKCSPVKGTPSSTNLSSSSSTNLKPASNNRNVRKSLNEEGIRFEDDGSYKKYPDLEKYVESIVFADRGSEMKAQSAQQIQGWRAKNKITSETHYFTEAVPPIFKNERMVKKEPQNFGEVVLWEHVSFREDGLDYRRDCAFVRGSLPQSLARTEKTYGLTNPQPDFVYGLEEPQFGDPVDKSLSESSRALIAVAPGLRHPWFAMETKSYLNPIEDAETQSLRTGAAMVSARRELNKRAGLSGVRQNLAIKRSSNEASKQNDSGLAQPEGQCENQSDEPIPEKPGVDYDSIAFTCSWVPQMANIHVHWHERIDDNKCLYHMNLVRGYLFSWKSHMSDFRRDTHNIQEYGLSGKRKAALGDILRRIAANGG